MITIVDIANLYFEMREADEHYGDSAEAKAKAVGLAEKFHELMERLRESRGECPHTKKAKYQCLDCGKFL